MLVLQLPPRPNASGRPVSSKVIVIQAKDVIKQESKVTRIGSAIRVVADACQNGIRMCQSIDHKESSSQAIRQTTKVRQRNVVDLPDIAKIIVRVSKDTTEFVDHARSETDE